MGQIVASIISCHAPALFLRQPGEDPAQLDANHGWYAPARANPRRDQAGRLNRRRGGVAEAMEKLSS